MTKRSLLSVVLVAAAAAALTGAARQAASPEARIDAVLSKWSAATPGCAIGVSLKGPSVIEKARGMADLEHDVPIRPDTIFRGRAPVEAVHGGPDPSSGVGRQALARRLGEAQK